MTPDGSPIIDRTDTRGFYVADGMCGHGFMFGPAVGKFMAGSIMDGAYPAEWSEFRIDRDYSRKGADAVIPTRHETERGMAMPVMIDGDRLRLEEFLKVARDRETVRLKKSAARKAERCRKTLDEFLETGIPTTGSIPDSALWPENISKRKT